MCEFSLTVARSNNPRAIKDGKKLYFTFRYCFKRDRSTATVVTIDD